MEEFLYYSPEDIIYTNLQETALRMDIVCEQEIAHLHELAQQITSEITESAGLITVLRDMQPLFKTELHAKTLPQNAVMLKRLHDFQNVWKAILLCQEIQNQPHMQARLTVESFFPDVEEPGPGSAGRIAYQRSNYADTAYLQFANTLTFPRAFYTHSFPDACEEVYNKLCEYCMLPIENSTEGSLNSFFRLIDQYNLKLAETCDITATDRSRTTRFALLRRNIVPRHIIKNTKELYVAFSAPIDARPSPAELLYAAQLCNLTPEKMDSRPQIDMPSKRDIHIVLRTEERNNLTTFLLYLFMQAPLCEIIGLYPHLTV